MSIPQDIPSRIGGRTRDVFAEKLGKRPKRIITGEEPVKAPRVEAEAPYGKELPIFGREALEAETEIPGLDIVQEEPTKDFPVFDKVVEIVTDQEKPIKATKEDPLGIIPIQNKVHETVDMVYSWLGAAGEAASAESKEMVFDIFYDASPKSIRQISEGALDTYKDAFLFGEKEQIVNFARQWFGPENFENFVRKYYPDELELARTETAFDMFASGVLRREGGYVKHPDDPGGATKFGISQKSYPKLNIKDLTQEEAVEIYRRDYWDKIQANDIQGVEVPIVMADLAVHAGVGSTRQRLRSKYGQDYIKGINEAIEREGEGNVAKDIIGLQQEHYFKLGASQKKNYLKFLKGWMHRLNDIRQSLNIDTIPKAEINQAFKEFQRGVNQELAKETKKLRVDGIVGNKTLGAWRSLPRNVRDRLYAQLVNKLRVEGPKPQIQKEQ